ncbi:RNase A-like domain-containing protein [Streptomyces sp. XY152]|uniref:RNase A-like domain-containing protein n=1 Tax=Streptomyces sp. XY152 TaxID=1415560 RepID=UPI000AC05044|nr:RNase A-like domain-containing protein [Streptomyces sp. XY152]
MTTPTAGGTPSGTVDVTPSLLYNVSTGIADQQDLLHRGVKAFLTELARYPDGGGRGTAVQSFTSAYKNVSERFLEVWAKSVVSVGGAAVGFTVTGNNYAAADAATNPSPTAQPQYQPPPVVIDTPPSYGPVTDFKWGDVDDGQDFVQRALEGVEAVVLTVLRPLLEDACRWGKAAEILPLPNHHRVNSVSEAWRMPQVTLSIADGMLTSLIQSITQQSDSEWYSAMRTFCSTLWGTSAWGKEQHGYHWRNDSFGSPGANHPVFAVLFDTCEVMVDAVYHFAKAAEDVREDLHRIYRKAVIDTLPQINLSDGVDLKDVKNLGRGLLKLGKGLVTDLSSGIVLNLDEQAMENAVTEYNNRIDRQTHRVKDLISALDEAHKSAPSFKAEEARAEAFGARALTDFKGDPLYTVPGDDESKHKYPVDLANQEGLAGAHVIDKHVGKTDAQLEQRLRDQARLYPDGVTRPIAVSTFNNLDEAQRYTQAVLDDPDNQHKIERWLSRNPTQPNQTRNIGLEFSQPVGRSWARGDAQAHDSDKVLVTLRPVPGGHPPYVVLTAMPSDTLPNS